MRLRLRTLMLIVALLALGLASPEPVLALALIFTCPLWFVAYARQSRGPGGPPSGELGDEPDRCSAGESSNDPPH